MAYMRQNPETGEMEYVDGSGTMNSPQTGQGVQQGDPFSMKNFLGTAAKYGAIGAGAATGAGAIANLFGGAAAGAAPSLSTGVSQFARSAMPGATSLGAPPAMSAAGMGAVMGGAHGAGMAGGGAGAGMSGAGGGGGAVNGMMAAPKLSTAVTPFARGAMPGVVQQGAGMGKGLMGFLQSNGGSSLVGGVLNGIGQMGQQRSNERMMNQQLGLQRDQMQQDNRQFGMNDQFNRDMATAGAAPTGWDQNYEQNQLIRNIMFQQLMQGPGGGGFAPTNASVAAKVGAQGSFKPTMPEDWAKMNPFGVDETQQSLAGRQGILDMMSGGRAPGRDFGAGGYDPTKAAGLNQQTGDYRTNINNEYRQTNPLYEAINRPTNGRPGNPNIPAGTNVGGIDFNALMQQIQQAQGPMQPQGPRNPYLRY